jgi:hypothetical protein
LIGCVALVSVTACALALVVIWLPESRLRMSALAFARAVADLALIVAGLALRIRRRGPPCARVCGRVAAEVLTWRA